MKFTLVIKWIIAGITLFLVTIGCNENPNHEQKILDELQSVKSELQSLKEQLKEVQDSNSTEQKDTLTIITKPKDTNFTTETEKPVLTTKETTPSKPQPTKPEEKIKRPGEEEELFYYKGSKKISLRITPWVDGRRQLIFYDKNGEITYTQDDTHLSYQEISEVKEIHENGAISKILINNNPGASRYWSDCVITFNPNNEPETRTITTYPMETISQNMDNVYLYDKTTKSWVLKKYP
jgi:hypothetical protein